MPELHVRKIRRIARAPVAAASITVGRSSECDLVLPHKSVSRKHCVLETADGVTRVRDLGSHYGTRVNGRKVDEAVLHDGDRIGVGPYDLAFVSEGEDADVAPPVETEALGPEETAVGLDDPVGAAEFSLDQRAAEAELASRQSAVDAERVALETERDELRALRDELETSRTELIAQRDAFATEQTEINAARETLTAEQAALDTARGTLATEQAALDTARDALDTGRDEALARERATHETARAELVARLERAATDLAAAQKAATRLETERDETRELLARAEAEIAALATQARGLESARQGAVGGITAAQQLFRRFAAHAEALVQTSIRFERAQEAVEALDARWLEFDEMTEDVDPDDSATLEALLHDRDALSGYLEAAHEARDDAARALHDEALRFGLASRSASIPDAPPPPVADPGRAARVRPRGRRWWPAAWSRSS